MVIVLLVLYFRSIVAKLTEQALYFLISSITTPDVGNTEYL